MDSVGGGAGARLPSGRDAAPGPGEMGHGVRTTWWYTVASVLFIDVGVLLGWATAAVGDGPGRVACYLVGIALAGTSTALFLLTYRREHHGHGFGFSIPGGRRAPAARWASCVAGAVLLGASTGSVTLGVAVLAQGICLLRWPAGTRLRATAVLTLALVALAVVEGARGSIEASGATTVGLLLTCAVMLPALASFTLWWWEIVEQLDRARMAEGRLAAAQERLSVANDVHDLQGHHLQVIALQLELAERLLTPDPDSALAQIRAARTSVDEARQGTRDLAMRFRGVPLPDELANAADLLRAAGLRVDLQMSDDAAGAPSDVLGPVVRETTTNVLKHGGGAWATMRLARDQGRWVYRIANDRTGTVRETAPGNGVAGIVDRLRAVDGDVRVEPSAGTFEIVVTVPARSREVMS